MLVILDILILNETFGKIEKVSEFWLLSQGMQLTGPFVTSISLVTVAIIAL